MQDECSRNAGFARRGAGEKRPTIRAGFDRRSDGQFARRRAICILRKTSPLQPNSPYAASKAAAEHFVRAARETFGIDTVITRCGNNYGQRQFPEKLIPLMIANAMNDEPLPVYGDGRNVRDWIYVEDHARADLAALRKRKIGRNLQHRRAQRAAKYRSRQIDSRRSRQTAQPDQICHRPARTRPPLRD